MAHNNYYLDLCVDIYVVHNNTVLLRYHDKYNFWTVPGGHIDAGQDANEAAIREVQEEAGLKVNLVGPSYWTKQDSPTNKDLVPPLFVNRHQINEHHDHSVFIFAAISESSKINPGVGEKDVPFKWLTKVELDRMYSRGEIRDEVYRYACAALEVVNLHNTDD